MFSKTKKMFLQKHLEIKIFFYFLNFANISDYKDYKNFIILLFLFFEKNF